MSRLIPTLMVAGAMAAPHAAVAQSSDTVWPGVIHVTASASADAIPDRASVSAAVQTQGATAQDAMSKNSELMRNVYSTLAQEGIPESDISTSYLNLNPQYNYEQRNNGQPRVVGYQASNQITVTTRDLDNVGPMIDALLKAGINSINNVQFSVKDTEAAHTAARTEAIRKARLKAKSMAEAADVKLGRLVSLTEGSAPGPLPYRQMMGDGLRMEAASMAPPVSAGQREITATVTLSYMIED